MSDNLDKEIVGRDGKRMLLVPAGYFQMGTSQTEINELQQLVNFKPSWCADEEPQRGVYLNAFYMDETPVTCREYKKFLDANRGIAVPANWDRLRRDFAPQFVDHPVTFVSWDDAAAYAKWAGKRLPTEAEWEKAARGTDERRFPWGRVWEASRCNTKEGKVGGTTPVYQYGNFGASPYGVLDMAGNVWEWCADWYEEDYYAHGPTQNPRGPTESDWRVLRGGAWDTSMDYARCGSRDYIVPDEGYATVGFRCVVGIR